MKKDLTELVFILDRSGSMGGLEADTIGGYNAMLTKQKTAKSRRITNAGEAAANAGSNHRRYCRFRLRVEQH